MANYPRNFPLLPGDQADVIRIYIDLMRERQRAEHPSQVTTNPPLTPGNGSDRVRFPDGVPDFD
ncbi:MAG TPA: hypothetical protein VMD29_12440 [Terracidiphilus sp.]|nr:hypothetical protein [Terracidiphilus sp.]